MNAADRRRLTPMLGIVAGILALLLVALWIGLGRGVHWQDTAAPPRLPPVGATLPAPTVPPLDQFARVWQHPLFSPTRTPGPPAGEQGKYSNDLQLTGVIMLPGLKMAILHDKTTSKDYRVIEGQPSNGGPALFDLQPRSAVVDASGSPLQLQLVPGVSPDAGETPVNGVPDNGAQAPQVQMGNAGNGDSAMVVRREDQDPNQTRRMGAELRASEARARALRARIEARRRGAHQDGGG